MAENVHKDIIKIAYSREAKDILRKIKKGNKTLFERIENQIIKILREPNIGKPLRYTLRNRRRLYIIA